MKCLLQLPSICSWVHNLDYFISASNKLNEISIWAESNLPGSGPICHHISLGVCCITAVFLCNQMRPQHLPLGGAHAVGGGGIGRRVVKKNIYIILQIHLKGQHIDSKRNTIMIIEFYFYRLELENLYLLLHVPLIYTNIYKDYQDHLAVKKGTQLAGRVTDPLFCTM